MLLGRAGQTSLPVGKEGLPPPSRDACWTPLFGSVLGAEQSGAKMDLYASTGVEAPDE